MNQYLAEVTEDLETGNLILTFPDELIAELGWFEGDNLKWTIENNQARLSKVE